MAAPTKSSRDELAQFLNDLDTLGGEEPPTTTSAATRAAAPTGAANKPSEANLKPETKNEQPGSHAKDAQDAMDFLDELSQRSSTPITIPAHTTQVPARKSLEGHRPSSRSSLRASPQPPVTAAAATPQAPAASTSTASASTPRTQAAPAPQGGAWGWSSMWSSASNVLQQAKETAEQNLAHISHQGLPSNIPTDSEQARKWTENMLGYVKQHTNVDVEKIRESGTKAFSDILNAVAPPISEHTVVQVYLSHDMVGYEGVETLVYRALAKVMEQLEGGELHVNTGSGEQPASSAQLTDDERNLNQVAGLTEGFKLARANLDNLIKSRSEQRAAASSKKSGEQDLPITVCPIYLRIQPVVAPLPFSVNDSDQKEQLYFIMVLKDAEHDLERSTMSQALPAAWLDIPFEENEWVENEMVDVIRKATETLGQDWIRTRQFGQAHAVQEAAKKLQADQEQQEKKEQQSADETATAPKNGSS